MPMIKTDFEEYVEKYSRKHGITKEEAKMHYLVKEYQRWKEEHDGFETRLQPVELESQT